MTTFIMQLLQYTVAFLLKTHHPSQRSSLVKPFKQMSFLYQELQCLMLELPKESFVDMSNERDKEVR